MLRSFHTATIRENGLKEVIQESNLNGAEEGTMQFAVSTEKLLDKVSTEKEIRTDLDEILRRLHQIEKVRAINRKKTINTKSNTKLMPVY